ncbi:hypothetical protein EX30DRAFT_394378 [Ascodesmis nigricans]|uniref:Ribosomal protein S21 n=1 Tax=Ascodesmis nigricans TaxID=341454 RepID=A0A4V3SJ95_9PEZI|nr:hypothetical protein EX30DRAFT_394378 [Ascodesmis nigricans]
MAVPRRAAMTLTRRPLLVPSTPSLLRTFTTTPRRLNTQRDKLNAVKNIFSTPQRTPQSSGPRRSPLGSLGALGSQISAAPSMAPVPHIEQKLPKMGPSAGRSIMVTQGLPQAFMKLNYVLRENNVKGMVKAAKEHERPGLKRKRLKRQRWRARFKEGFKRMVQTALKMKKMGM